jgi:hypothetical protein
VAGDGLFEVAMDILSAGENEEDIKMGRCGYGAV